MGVDLLVYLSGRVKIKPPTESGRRERISVHHDELITGVDFCFSVQIFFNSAVGVLQTLVIALGAGLAIWGVINLMEGYGSDNPGANAHVR